VIAGLLVLGIITGHENCLKADKYSDMRFGEICRVLFIIEEPTAICDTGCIIIVEYRKDKGEISWTFRH